MMGFMVITFIVFKSTVLKDSDPRVREFLRYVLSAEGQQVSSERAPICRLPENVRQAQLREIP